MKRVLVLVVLSVFCFSVYGQFGGMMNKLKNKVANKLMGSKDSTAAAGSAGAAGTAGGGSAGAGSAASTGGASGGSSGTEGSGTGGPAVAGANSSGGAYGPDGQGGHPTPQRPSFPTTGKMITATKVIFGVDTEDDWAALLKNPMVQDLIGRLRQRGLTGTDLEVVNTAMQHQEDYTDIMSDMRAKYGANASFKTPPSLVFSVFFNEYDYVMTNDHIRAEPGIDTSTSHPSLGGAFVNALAPGVVAIIDINARKSYTVANYLGILPAAVEDDLASFQDAFGLANYFKKYMHQPNIQMQPMGQKTFHGYNCHVVRLEIPVTPTVDENGKSSDGLLFLHSLLSGTMDMGAKHYDPSYKLYLETYYSHDLDGSVPASVVADKGILHVDGFYVGSTLKDENGNEVTYNIKKVERSLQVDAGQFMIPDGYEKMTHAEFKAKLKAKLHGQ